MVRRVRSVWRTASSITRGPTAGTSACTGQPGSLRPHRLQRGHADHHLRSV